MIAQVILRSYSLLSEAFSYRVPSELEKTLQPGLLVTLPFRNKTEKALVLKILPEDAPPHFKTIEGIISNGPVLLPFQIELAYWMSQYYVCPLFKCVSLFLPHFIWEDKQQDWVNREIFIAIGTNRKPTGPKEKKISTILASQKNITLDTLQTLVEHLTVPYLKNLEKKGLVLLTEGEIVPPYFKEYNLRDIAVVEAAGLKKLTALQQEALDAIHNKPVGIFLLHGITASGKTEVYLHLAYENWLKKKQTLILVPEIALTPQLIAYFFKVFGKHISVLHSQLSDGEKFTEWVRIKNQESWVVIGSRSALFSPFQKLGTIVLDEEHEWTYKNDQNPRYHAREVAVYLNQKIGANLILGSATPDTESYFKAQSGMYTLLQLSEKINVAS